MKVAIVGSQNANESNFVHILPPETSEIISGGVGKIAECAQKTAQQLQLPLKTFLPDYTSFGENAHLHRNDAIIQYADFLLIFWNGHSPGTRYMIEQCKQLKKNHLVLQTEITSVSLPLDNTEK